MKKLVSIYYLLHSLYQRVLNRISCDHLCVLQDINKLSFTQKSERKLSFFSEHGLMCVNLAHPHDTSTFHNLWRSEILVKNQTLIRPQRISVSKNIFK